MSEHTAPRAGSRVGVTARAKARNILLTRLREGNSTIVSLTRGSAKWCKREAAAMRGGPHALDSFYSVHGNPFGTKGVLDSNASV